MGALGRALAKGVSGAANTAASALFKDYERQGDTAAKMSLQEHAAALQEKLEAKKQEFQAGESALTRTHEAGMNTARITSQEGIATKDRDARVAEAETRSTEANRHNLAIERLQGQSNAISAQRVQLEQARQNFEQSNTLDINTKTMLDNITKQQAGVQADIAKLRGDEPDYAQRLEQANKVLSALNTKFEQTLLGRHGPSPQVTPYTEKPPGKPAEKPAEKPADRLSTERPGGGPPAAAQATGGLARRLDADGNPVEIPGERALGAIGELLNADRDRTSRANEEVLYRNLFARKESGEQLSRENEERLAELEKKYGPRKAGGAIKR